MSNNMEELLNLNSRKKVEKKSIISMDDLRNDVVKMAEEILAKRKGNNYVWGKKGPDYFDCSGFSSYVFKKTGLKIPEGSVNQSEYVNHNLKRKDLKPGDLVFFDTAKKKGKVGHVGIYIGEGKFIDSGGGGERNKTVATAGHGVRISNLDSEKWQKRFLGGSSLEKIAVKNNIVTKSKETIKKGIDTSDKAVTVENKEKLKKDIERFESIFKYLIDVEGGYSNHKNDKGGATKYGIIEIEARKYGYKGDMRNFPLESAKEIYKNKYFYRNKLDKINDDRIALSICDWIVNSGANGVKKAQKVLNTLNENSNLTVDGIIGKHTLEALNSVDPEKFLKAYHISQREYYNNIVKRNPEQGVFLKGWQNRVSKKEDFIKNNLNINNKEPLKNLSEWIDKAVSELSPNLKEQKNENNMKNIVR
ncbi:hypothetical protein EII29_01320 [Leptotrichia sp. OH3620_COT-345]|uniref:NlpC/P60 family protein n=1 Tax=Leptotrichia sp. OH3620_COT-345 TaxID=2491048 RepID=UPI000F64BB3A|nr:NlpC/P60 family protein [Leptotrichia sp. OH3620_COT-345]RRD40610.1 hypothetical protein EII29_01320 [Leptotrichia sp. OH3620_COT-345]